MGNVRAPTREGDVSQMLAAEMVATPFHAIPRACIDAARNLLIDHVGITYMGAAHIGRELIAYAKDIGGRPDAVLIGDGARLPAEVAAGINGHFCRSTNFEDTGPGRHIGPLAVHTALAVGQRRHASGRDVLAAVALGYVLCGRFHFARRTGPISGTPEHRMVAAAIASRLLGYDQATTATALNLAWELPHREPMPGQLAAHGSNFVTKRISPLGTPSALATPLYHARGGVQAALMAGHGFKSVPNEIGQFLHDYDVPALTVDPTPFRFLHGEMELKPWICSRQSQTGIQALSDLLDEHAIDAGRVTALRLRLTFMSLVPHQIDPAPDDYWQAIYSTNWCAAMVLQRIAAGPQWVSPERIADPVSRRLAAMVEVLEDPESSQIYRDRLTKGRAAVRGTAEIEAGGRTYRAIRTLGETYGSPGKEMTAAMVEAKFHECVAPSLGRDRASQLLQSLRSIEDINDVNDVAALMTSDRRRA
ncbi:MAG: MmgE/PrpD family protein [Alphaproteobacteria bacterium]|nr:MmgE/PrpD family protein [Alphaproteobacteria bacterium]